MLKISSNRILKQSTQLKRIVKQSKQKTSKQSTGGQLKIKQQMFIQTQLVCSPGHFVNPSSHSSFSSQKLHIICKGYGKDSVQISLQVLNTLKQSLLSLVQQNNQFQRVFKEINGNQLNEFSKHRYFMLNLIDSCFEELSASKLEGSCSFGITYIANNVLFIVKNKMIQCYMLQKGKKQHKFTNLSSKKLPFQINTIQSKRQYIQSQISSDSTSQINNTSRKETKGFLVCDSSYENVIQKKYFPEVQFLQFPIPILSFNSHFYFMMGNSQCFCHFTENQLIDLMRFQCSHLKKSANELINTSRKKWKTIYQQDMTIIISKIKPVIN